MSLSHEKKSQVKEVLKTSIAKKFETYHPETENMPFHYRLLGKDRMALFSFIQSLNTTFGTSIYEPVAIELAKDVFRQVEIQAKPPNHISAEAQRVIQDIINNISTAKSDPDKETELRRIRQVCQAGPLQEVKLTKIDIRLVSTGGELYLIDMKTAKPNMGEFKGFKRTLLEWAAAVMAVDPNVKVYSLIAISYNPYEPKPYDRWTMKGIFDLKNEILVAEELWDFLGGKGTYSDLLDCFEAAGKELRPLIDDYFSKLKYRGR